jgi:hypothetical protein
MDNADAYIRKDDLIPMREEDYDKEKKIGAAADFAISKGDMANRTSFTIGGKSADNLLHFLDFQVGRWDSKEIVDKMFEIEDRWHPDFFWVEGGQIWKAIWPMIRDEMLDRDRWINIEVRNPVKDKASRGRSLQKRTRAGGTRWDTKASGYESAIQEILKFTGTSQATLDDQFDSAALLALGFDDGAPLDNEDFIEDDEAEFRRQDPHRNEGRNQVTGY